MEFHDQDYELWNSSVSDGADICCSVSNNVINENNVKLSNCDLMCPPGSRAVNGVRRICLLLLFMIMNLG